MVLDVAVNYHVSDTHIPTSNSSLREVKDWPPRRLVSWADVDVTGTWPVTVVGASELLVGGSDGEEVVDVGAEEDAAVRGLKIDRVADG